MSLDPRLEPSRVSIFGRTAAEIRNQLFVINRSQRRERYVKNHRRHRHKHHRERHHCSSSSSPLSSSSSSSTPRLRLDHRSSHHRSSHHHSRSSSHTSHGRSRELGDFATISTN